MKTLLNAALLLTLVSATARAQINAGEQKPEPSLPFTMTQVATFKLPWRIAFLPDGRMLITEKVGPVWLVTQQGEKTPVDERPGRPVPGPGRHAGRVPVAALRDRPQRLPHLCGAGRRPGTSGLALARARADARRRARRASTDCRCCGATCRRAAADSSAPQIAFSPDGQYLFLTVGDRQRMTPAQDPNTALGKILRLTLDGKPAPGNPMAGKTGAASRAADQSAARHGSGQDRARGQHVHVPGAEPGARGDLDQRSSHALRSGVRARRPAVGSRARPERRRRAEPDRARQELRLAARVLRHQLQRRADPESGYAARSGQAGDLLDADHRAGQSHVLQRRDVPAVAAARR